MKVFRGKGDKRKITTTPIEDSLVKKTKSTEKGGLRTKLFLPTSVACCSHPWESTNRLIPEPAVALQAS